MTRYLISWLFVNFYNMNFRRLTTIPYYVVYFERLHMLIYKRNFNSKEFSKLELFVASTTLNVPTYEVILSLIHFMLFSYTYEIYNWYSIFALFVLRLQCLCSWDITNSITYAGIIILPFPHSVDMKSRKRTEMLQSSLPTSNVSW